MTDFLKRTWAEIRLDALTENLAGIRRMLRPGCMLMGVVKADAYGHGDRRCAAFMEQNGVDWFGVSNLDEALSLRGGGITRPILVLGPTPADLAGTLAKAQITQTVFCSEYAEQLSCEAQRQGVRVAAHIKIDTGMGRIGFDSFSLQACTDAVARAVSLPGLDCGGIFTHFASADEDPPDADDYTRAQYGRFMQVIESLERQGIHFQIRHCCNSAATLRFPSMHLDMVRPGLILYGLYPSGCCKGILPLSPVMQLKSVVSMVKHMPAGRFVSYGRTFSSTAGDTVVATIPIGYADGYHRAFSNQGQMLLHAKPAPVIGRVCMDQLMLDVSAIGGVRAGDEVTVFGADGDAQIPVETLASAAGTINYEVVCLVGKRVPRLYIQNGTPLCAEQYSPRYR